MVLHSQEFFEPEDGIVASTYVDEYELAVQSTMREHLDAYACYKLVAIPSIGTEWAVDVAINDTKAWVTGVKVGTRIFSIYQKKDPNYKVSKIFRNIDLGLATKIESLSQTIISEVRYSPTANSGMDGVTFHFSSWTKDQGFRFGKTWSPDEGSRTSLVTDLGSLLLKYAFSEMDRYQIQEFIGKSA
jgi:hypothetical protein